MITIFCTFYDTHPYHIPVYVALERIRSGKSAKLIEWVKQQDYKNRKKQLPCILVAGKFTQRSISGLIEHSGLICLDFDRFPNEETLQTYRDSLIDDIYTYALFISPSGLGLKLLVKIPPTDYKGHKAFFRGLQNYYNCEYFDVNVFDVSRICFESYDPELFVNENSEVWRTQIFDPEPVLIPCNNASLSDQETVRRLLKWADRKYPIINGCRNQNLYRLACSLNDFGIDKEYALSICSQFQADDFGIREIETTVGSAYRKTSKHGSVKF